MSQSFAIKRVRHSGAPVYVGEVDGTDTWSANPERIINWLCDGWRSRFNQHRAWRAKSVWEPDPDRPGQRRRVTDSHEDLILVPKGDPDCYLTDAQVRKACSWLAAIPNLVLQAPDRIESTEWWAANKRRMTLANKHRPGGAMPGFKSRKREQRFTCWYNAGRGYNVHRTGRRSGVMTLVGINPAGHRQPGQPAKWKLTIHFRMSADVLPSTSVQVDWMHKRLTFISPPPERTAPTTGAMVGVDAGVVHAVALSDGTFRDLPDLSNSERLRKQHQRAMAKHREQAKREGREFWRSSRYQEHKRLAAKHSAHIAAVRREFAHQVSNELVRDHDLIVFENLDIRAMTKSARGTVTNPGVQVAQKRGLNRSILHAAWGLTRDLCVDKASRTPGKTVRLVDPQHTSQRCRHCGHISPNNRESQAVFRCVRCGHTDNADTNAAGNILDRETLGWTSPAPRDSKTGISDADTACLDDTRTPALPREG